MRILARQNQITSFYPKIYMRYSRLYYQMALNSNTAYLQYSADFSLLGKSMKRFAIVNWISLGFGFIGAILMQIVFLAPMMNILESGTLIDPIDTLLGMGGIFIFIIIAMSAISIYRIVTYIQYLMQLKKVGEYTNDLDLQKAYKMELWAIIISFIMTFILMIGIYLLFSNMDALFFMADEAAIYDFLMLILGVFFVIFIVAILSIVFQILSVVSFDRWGQKLKMMNPQNRNAVNVAEGTNFMKWGRIITFIAATIGMILYLVGFMKAADNIIEFFDGYGNIQSTQGSPFQQTSGSTTNPNLNTSNMGNTSYGNTTLKPQSEGFCSFCGSKLEDKNSMFCSNCGRKLF